LLIVKIKSCSIDRSLLYEWQGITLRTARKSAGAARHRFSATVETAVPDTKFETSRPPGHYDNEGGGIRSHLGEPYGPGFYAFGELPVQCRSKGSMEQMELRS